MLRDVLLYVERYCNGYGQRWLEEVGLSITYQDVQLISPLAAMSIIALGETLTSTACCIYEVANADLRMH
jgi:hypothetical protein